MKSLVAGNWKMNGSLASIAALLDGLTPFSDESVDVAVIPPYVYLETVKRQLGQSQIQLGAQHLDWRSEGAFTGEIAAHMLVELGCHYCLVGHSERRQYFGDTDERVADRFKACLEAGLVPVLCVGESLDERQAGKTGEVVSRQLAAVTDLVGDQIGKGVIAYEPVWAIGTGESATPDMAQEVHALIRQQIAAVTPASETRLLYGGSVNPKNAEALFAQRDIDGALVGGASLKAEDFVAICEAASNAI